MFCFVLATSYPKRSPQFALANWTFLDAAILSAHAKDPYGDPTGHPHVTFLDWIPGICSLLGFLIVTLIDKDRIRGEDGFGDSRAVWRARLFLFIGFAFMAGGMAGSIVSAVFILSGHYAHHPLDCPCPQICPPKLCGNVHILWLRQRQPEYRHGPQRCYSLGQPEQQ